MRNCQLSEARLRLQRWVQEGRHALLLVVEVEEKPCSIQRFTDRHVHVEISIGTQTSDEADALFGVCESDVVDQLFFFLNQPDGVIWCVVRSAFARVFTVAHRSVMLFPWREMLVFGDAGVGDGGFPVIHHRASPDSRRHR